MFDNLNRSRHSAVRVQHQGGSADLWGACQGEHFVQFYRDDEALIQTVASFVSDGLNVGGKAVVIATDRHLDALSSYLATSTVAFAEAQGQRRYIALDATETLAKFMVDDEPQAALFEKHVGTLIADLAADGASVYAFGEMVALLWAEGKRTAALQLEALWNDLGRRYPFTLFCAYPIAGFANDQGAEPFLQVCKAHHRVVSPTGGHVSEPAKPVDLTAAMLQQKAAALELEARTRKEAQEALRQRDAELRAFVETASMGLHWVDENGIILWANAAELQMLGYHATEYVGRDITDFYDDKSVINDILNRLRRGERIQNFRARLRCKDGSIKTVAIDSSVLWEGDRFVHTQCFTRDITEQCRAEAASRHLASIVESSDDAIVSKNLDGIIMSWNRSAQRIFGYTADEVIGKSITILIPEDRLSEEPQILARLRRGERVDHFETIRRRKDGTHVDISLTISPIKDSSGQVVGASKIARDISDRKRAEAALEEARQQLARTNEELEQRVAERTSSLREAVAQMEEFSYTVSHDLRAPLRGMQVYSQALLEDYQASLDSEAQHCLVRIHENANRLDRMVTDVLTFSRVSRAEVVLSRVALDALVRSVIEHYPALQPPRARVIVATLAEVKGHEPSLTQIVSNLLSNAVKFVPAGVVPEVKVWTETVDKSVRLFVRDNGIGISPDQHKRLFKMFERIRPELPYEGTGVGLAIVRKAAQRMGGDVGVESDGVNGATFWVQLRTAGQG